MLRQFARGLTKSLDLKSIATRGLSTTSVCGADATAKVDATPPTEETKPVEPPPKTVLVEKDDNITMIGINRPKQRNAINASTAAQLCTAFSEFEADETSPVAVLYGIGGSFCSGYDILELSTDNDHQVSIDMLMQAEGSVGPTRRRLLKPVVCGINGYCVANGFELALMCDLRVMEETAVLGFFNRRFGVPLIDGGTARLPAMIGLSRALDLILTGRPVEAPEALQMGIVNRVVPTGSSLCAAIELARTLAKFSQFALLHDRKSVYSAVFDAATFDQSIQNEIMYTSKDIIEEMEEGIKWFNKTFTSDTAGSFLKRQNSMADWDNEDVAAAAAKKVLEKQALEAERIEAEKQLKEEKQNRKKSKAESKEDKAKKEDKSKKDD